METPDVTKTETCPRCGRQRVWALWRKCECGYDFGPEVPAGYSAEPQKREPDPPRVISHLERSVMLVVSWIGCCGLWVLAWYGPRFFSGGSFLGLMIVLAGRYAEGFRVGLPRWLKFANYGAVAFLLLGFSLMFWFDVPDRPEKLAIAPPFHRFLHQVFPLTAIPVLVLTGYYFFLIITRRVTQAEPEKS